MSEDSLTYPIAGDRLAMKVKVLRTLASRQTAYQHVRIVETDAFGRMLLLDGHIQLAETDEFAYHEALVHIPMSNLANARSALVLGGGDGGVLRELVRHRGLHSITMVELDPGVIELCKQHLPEIGGDGWTDPRVTVHIGDALRYVPTITEPVDLIVMDVTDAYEDEPGSLSEPLWGDAFFADCRRALSPEGLLVCQADNPLFCPGSARRTLQALGKVFPKTGLYQALVPSFGGLSAFVWAGNQVEPAPEWPADAAARLGLRYLDQATYDFAFDGVLLPKDLQSALRPSMLGG